MVGTLPYKQPSYFCSFKYPYEHLGMHSNLMNNDNDIFLCTYPGPKKIVAQISHVPLVGPTQFPTLFRPKNTKLKDDTKKPLLLSLKSGFMIKRTMLSLFTLLLALKLSGYLRNTGFIIIYDHNPHFLFTMLDPVPIFCLLS